MPPWQKYAAPQQVASPWSKYGQQVGDAYAGFGQSVAAPLPPVKDPHTPGYYRAAAAFQKQQPTSGVGAAIRGPLGAFSNGQTLGFTDEALGAVRAGDTAISRMFGKNPGYTPGEAYQAQRDVVRGSEDQFADKHPGVNLALNLAGGAVAPGSLGAGKYVMSTPRVIGQIGRGAEVGAQYGAVAGFGNGRGDLAHHIDDAGVGGVEGGVLGGAVPGVVGTVVKPVVRGSADLLRRTGQFIAGTDPEAAAMAAPNARHVSAAMSRVQQMMAVKGMTPADLASAQNNAFGKPITTDEAIGRHAVTEASSLGRRLGSAPDAMEAQYTERAQQAPDRMLGDFADIAGIDPAAAKGDIDQLVANGQAGVKPLYDTVRATPGPIWNDALANLAQRPVIKKAMGSAFTSLQNAGKDPTAIGLAVDPDTGAPAIGEDLTQTTQLQPTAEAWDLIKKHVGFQRARDTFNRPIPDNIHPGNYDVGVADRDLTAALREAMPPEYGQALDGSGDYLRLQTAFNNGQNMIANPRVSAGQYADHFGALSDAEQQAHLGGVANKLFDMAQNGQLKANSFKAPKIQAKLGVALGDGGAQQLLDRASVEQQMNKFGGTKMPGAGSQTMPLQYAAGADAAPSGFADAAGMVGGVFRQPMAAIPRIVDKTIAYSRSAGTSPQYRGALDQIYRQPPAVTAGQLGDAASAGLLRMPMPAMSPGLLGNTVGDYADPQVQLFAPSVASQ